MNKLLYFCLGAGLGSIATYYFVKQKYEQIAQEEIDSVKKVFARREVENSVKTDDSEITKNEYETVIKAESYDTVPVSNDKRSGIYVIAPSEFGEFPDYNQVSLKYLSDGIIVDEDGEIADDFVDFTEEDFLDHFGEYEEDSVYIRNDMRCCDYEILQDERTYEEYMEKR